MPIFHEERWKPSAWKNPLDMSKVTLDPPNPNLFPLGRNIDSNTEESKRSGACCFKQNNSFQIQRPIGKPIESEPSVVFDYTTASGERFRWCGGLQKGSKIEEPNTAPAFALFPSGGLSIGGPGKCKYCLEVDKHSTATCPYRECVPKTATVSDACEIVCRNCGRYFFGSCCGLDEGRAILKTCSDCAESGHWPRNCPRKVEVNKKSTQVPLNP